MGSGACGECGQSFSICDECGTRLKQEGVRVNEFSNCFCIQDKLFCSVACATKFLCSKEKEIRRGEGGKTPFCPSEIDKDTLRFRIEGKGLLSAFIGLLKEKEKTPVEELVTCLEREHTHGEGLTEAVAKSLQKVKAQMEK